MPDDGPLSDSENPDGAELFADQTPSDETIGTLRKPAFHWSGNRSHTVSLDSVDE